jgi:hypothetical protein
METIIASHSSFSAVAIAHGFFHKVTSVEAIENCFPQGGGIELYGEIALFADISARLQEQATKANCDFPAIYAYDVDGDFGEYLASKVKEQTYDKELAIDHLYSMVEAYFMAYEENAPRLGFLKRVTAPTTLQQRIRTAKKQAIDFQYLNTLDESMQVKSLYDDDQKLCSALNTLIVGFEYPNYAGMTLGQVKAKIIEPLNVLGFDSFEEVLAHHETMFRSKQTAVVVSPCTP